MAQVPEKPRPKPNRDAMRNADPADEVYIHLSDRDRDIVLKTIDADSPPDMKRCQEPFPITGS